MANGIGKRRQMVEQTGQAVYSQAQMVARAEGPGAWQGAKLVKQRPHPQGNLSSPGLSSLEITSRPQLYFSSRPRKAAKPGELPQNELQ